MSTPTADLSGGPVLLSLSLGTVLFALATTFVRFSVRAGVSKRFGADDYASGAATVSLVGGDGNLRVWRVLMRGNSWWH